MVHTVLIGIHALAGAVSFGAGVLAMPLTHTRSWRLRLYLVSLVAMALTLVAAVAWNWQHYAPGVQAASAALCALALLMLVRAYHAYTRLRLRDRDWRARYLDAVGFTLISLLDAFVIVAAIDLGGPVWLVVVTAIAGIVVGVWAKNSAKRRILAGSADGRGRAPSLDLPR